MSNRYSWHTTTEQDSGGWFKCTAIVVFPGNTVKFDSYPFYKPNRKGHHSHNHVFNVCHRIIFRSKSARHLKPNDRKELMRTFYENLWMNPEVISKILATRNKRRKQQ